MKERPILFSAPMVRAILEGRKTQTRRVVKPGPPDGLGMYACLGAWRYEGVDYRANEVEMCPYGVPGDRLYVREQFSYLWGHGPKNFGSPIWYWADGQPDYGDWTRPKSSIHMPRWASRITLEITGVRVERLQEISEAGARAEGTSKFEWELDNGECPDTHADAYRLLWESINGPGSWNANPWVWVVEFRRILP